MLLIEAKNLNIWKRLYWKRTLILENVNLEIRKGENLAILGPNGAGKSTLAGYLLKRYPSKAVHFKKAMKISFCAQGSFPRLKTIEQTLNAFAKMVQAAPAYLNYLKELFGIDDFIKVPFKNLSKGQKQKLKLLVVFINQPEVIILDEWTSSLDQESIKEISHILKTMAQEKGVTYIIISHEINIIMELAHAYCEIKKQKLGPKINIVDQAQARQEILDIFSTYKKDKDETKANLFSH